MKRVLVALLCVVAFGCASNPAPREVQLRQAVLTAIDALQVLASGVEAAVKSSPPLLTNAQANQVWDIEIAAVKVLKATNSNAYDILRVALEQMELLLFAQTLRPYLSVARLTLAALMPPKTARRLPFWGPCVIQYSGCGPASTF